MNIPEIFEYLINLPWLSGVYLVIPFLILSIVLGLSSTWSISLFSLFCLYFSAGLLIVNVVPPHFALLLWLVGFFATLIFFITKRQNGRSHSGPPEILPILLQLLGVLVIVLVGWSLEFFGLFSFLSLDQAGSGHPYAGFIIFLILCMGLFRFVSAKRIIFAGIGLLLILLALVLFQATLTPNRWVLWAWAFASLLLTVIVSFLSIQENERSARVSA